MFLIDKKTKFFATSRNGVTIIDSADLEVATDDHKHVEGHVQIILRPGKYNPLPAYKTRLFVLLPTDRLLVDVSVTLTNIQRIDGKVKMVFKVPRQVLCSSKPLK